MGLVVSGGREMGQSGQVPCADTPVPRYRYTHAHPAACSCSRTHTGAS